MVVFKVFYGHSFFYFLFMSFVKDLFREFGFALCISEVFPMFFKSCVEVSVGSSYIKFVAVGACQFINPLHVIFVILFYFIWDYVVQFVICFVGYFYIFIYFSEYCCRSCWFIACICEIFPSVQKHDIFLVLTYFLSFTQYLVSRFFTPF